MYAYVGNTPTGWVDPSGYARRKAQPMPPEKLYPIIGPAIRQPACDKARAALGGGLLERAVRCIIKAESTDDPKACGPRVKCMGHRERACGLMQLMPHGAGADCAGWGYPNWSTDPSQNVGCGVHKLCDALAGHNFDLMDPHLISLFNGIDTPVFLDCMITDLD